MEKIVAEEQEEKEYEYEQFIQEFLDTTFTGFYNGLFTDRELDARLSYDIQKAVYTEVRNTYDSEKYHITKARIQRAMQEAVSSNIMFFADPKNTVYLKMRRLLSEAKRKSNTQCDEIAWIALAFEPEFDDYNYAITPYYPYYWFEMVKKELVNRSIEFDKYKELAAFFKKYAEESAESTEESEKGIPLSEATKKCSSILNKFVNCAEKRVTTYLKRDRYREFESEVRPIGLSYLYTQAYGMKFNDQEREVIKEVFTPEQLKEFPKIKEKYFKPSVN